MPTPEDMLSEIGTPSVYPHRYEPARARVLMIRMREADYRAASFLDDRMLTGETEGAWVPYARAAEAAAALAGAKPLHFIFHLGHVGSTLLSRLLDEIPGVLSLREPLPLRTLAEEPEAGALETFLRLWSRGFESTRAVVLKATSSAARIAPQLLAARPPGVPGTPSINGARAVYMYLAAEPYLATLLAGENSPLDLKGHEAERTARLAAHLRCARATRHVAGRTCGAELAGRTDDHGSGHAEVSRSCAGTRFRRDAGRRRGSARARGESFRFAGRCRAACRGRKRRRAHALFQGAGL